MKKSEARNIIKERKEITESADLRTNCKKCFYYGTQSKVCQIHLLKTKSTEVCPEFTTQRKATIFRGGAASPR